MLVTTPYGATLVDSTRLQPLARTVSALSLGIGLLFIFGFGQGPPINGFFPAPFGLLILAAAIGVLPLAPRDLVLRLPVSIGYIATVLWIVASVFWTASPGGTQFALIESLPVWLATYIFASLLSSDDIQTVFVWLARIVVWSSLAAGALFAEARINGLGTELEVDGWHGLFVHKNFMSPLVALGIITVLAFDKNAVTRWFTVIAAAILLFLSDSVTGISAAMAAVGFWYWMGLLVKRDERGGGFFFAVSAVFGAFAVVGLVASIGQIVVASGKDLTFTGRTDIWSTTVDFIAQRPLTGWGLGGLFDVGGSGINPETLVFWRSVGFNAFHAHNGPLDLALQLGIPGVILMGAFMFSAGFTAWRLKRDFPFIAAWMLTAVLIQAYTSLSEANFLGGWFAILILVRVWGMRLAQAKRIGEAV